MSQVPEEELPPVEAELPEPVGPAGLWTFGDICIVFFFYLFWPSLVAALLLQGNIIVWVLPDAAYLERTLARPTDRTATQQALGEIAGPVAAKVTEPEYHKVASARVSLWAYALAAAFQIATIPLWFVWRYGTPLAALGLTTRGWPRAVRLGLLGALVLTPAVLLFHEGFVRLYAALVKVPTEEHDLALLGHQALLPIEWVFWVGLAVVIAPVLEEILFRGVVQGYVLAHPLGGYFIAAGALLLVAALNNDAMQAVRDSPGWEKLDAFMPVLFVLLLALGYLATREYGAKRLQAIFVTALLFAAIHSTWPQPVALFVLALGLGYLREWSGSLVAPILVHALFNGTSTVLFFGWGI